MNPLWFVHYVTRMAKRSFVFGLLTFLLYFSRGLSAQVLPSLTNGVDPRGTYASNGFDSVDPVTGRLNISLPLLTDHSQRGNLNFSYSVVWSGFGSWSQVCGDTDCYWAGGVTGNSKVLGPAAVMNNALGGFNNGGNAFEVTPCVEVVEAGVGTHPIQGSDPSTPTSCPDYSSSYTMESLDATGIQYSYNAAASDVTLTNPSGVRFHYTDNASAPSIPKPYIEDPDGNKITSAAPWTAATDMGTDLFTGNSTLTSGTRLWTLMDTLNRPWTLDYSESTDDAPIAQCPSGATNAYFWNTPGMGNISRQFIFCYSNVSFATNFGNPYVEDLTGTYPMLTQVILPDGTSYKFQYNDGYGDLTELDLPTGATISYTYSTIADPCLGGNELRIVATRTSSDGVSGPQLWNYAYSPGYSPGTQVSLTVTNPLGGVTTYKNTGSCEPVGSVQYNDKDGTLIRTDTTSYESFVETFSYDDYLHLPTGTTTVWGTNGPVSYTSQIYDTPGYAWSYVTHEISYVPYGLVTAKTLSDYGGNTITQTNTKYWAMSHPSYLAANILNPAQEITVWGAQPDSSTLNMCSDTVYSYDDAGSVVSSEITTQHDTSITPMANLTSIQQNLFPSCQSTAPSYTSLTSYRTVYDTGMLKQAKDPAGNVTMYSYSPSFAGAYPTTITNALGQSISMNYDFYTGLMTSSTDANEQQTMYSYDGMLRPHETDYPDGGQETWTAAYSGSIYVGSTYTRKIDSLNTYSATSVNDGLGRPIHLQVADPQGTIYTDTTYDAIGRVASVSNPYRSSDSSHGVTSYAYDILGRMRLQCNPDNGNNTPCNPGASYKRWKYNGNVTDVYDEDGVHTEQTSDGVGRLTTVLEADASGALSLETDYTYDGLNNLTQIVQHGTGGDTPRIRAFSYDSLSRPTSATNPETGTISYSYDAASNVISKTDARGITTGYTYDSLNRLTGKSYQSDPSNTPSTCFLYDTNTSHAPVNAIGRLTAEWTQNGACPANAASVPSSGVTTAKIVTSYDGLGRLLTELSCILNNCTQNSYHPQTFSYNAAGKLSGYDDGWGLQFFSRNYDAAGRLQFLTSSWNDATHPATLYGVENYGPFGVLNSTMGDHLAITKAYDSRERVTKLTGAQQ